MNPKELINSTIIEDPIIEPFLISKDQTSYTLWEKITPNLENKKTTKGKMYYKAVGYYSKFEPLLNKIAELKLNSTKKYNSIKEFIQQYNKEVINIQKQIKL
jgi:hypothetical protein